MYDHALAGSTCKTQRRKNFNFIKAPNFYSYPKEIDNKRMLRISVESLTVHKKILYALGEEKDTYLVIQPNFSSKILIFAS